MKRSGKLLAAITPLIAVALVGLAPAAQSAGAAGCVHSGERAFHVSHEVLIVGPKGKNSPIDDQTSSRYACSTRYGKRVYLGEFGINPDGEEFIHSWAATKNFLAFVTGRAGNAGGGLDLTVQVANLRLGKIVTKTPAAALPEPSAVIRLRLTPEGRVGWIATEIYVDPGAKPIIGVLAARGAQHEVLDQGTDIDPLFLRFDTDRRTLLWSAVGGKSTPAPPTPTTWPDERASGHCLRKGETVYFSDLGTVLIKRPFSKPGWKRGFDLIGCAGGTRKRYLLGRFGRHPAADPNDGEVKVELANKAVNSRFAAIAVRRSGDDVEFGVPQDTIRVFNLVNGQHFTHDAAAQQTPGTAPVALNVTSLVLNSYGDSAWVVRRGAIDAPGTRTYEVHLRDSSGERIVAAGKTIDPMFLGFGAYLTTGSRDGSLHWSEKTGSAEVH